MTCLSALAQGSWDVRPSLAGFPLFWHARIPHLAGHKPSKRNGFRAMPSLFQPRRGWRIPMWVDIVREEQLRGCQVS